jgi:hypothetical protein
MFHGFVVGVGAGASASTLVVIFFPFLVCGHGIVLLICHVIAETPHKSTIYIYNKYNNTKIKIVAHL